MVKGGSYCQLGQTDQGIAGSSSRFHCTLIFTHLFIACIISLLQSAIDKPYEKFMNLLKQALFKPKLLKMGHIDPNT